MTASKWPLQAPPPAPGLRRTLRATDLTAIGVNATVGSGIFLLPDDLFRAMGFWSPLSFGICALGLFPVAWCFAEASRVTDASGGPYEYAHRELGPLVGFGVGWMCFVNAVFSFAAVASAAASYAGRLFPALNGASAIRSCAVIAIFAFGILNLVGARPGAWAIRFLTVGKILVLLLLMSVLLPHMELPTAKTEVPFSFSPPSVGSAIFMALFALQGFETVPVPAAEAHSPRSKIPFAIFSTLATTALLYVLIQSVLVFGFDGIADVSDAPLADAALQLAPSLGLVVTLGALVSTLGFVSGSALGTPRYLFAMASHRQLPALFSQLHPTFGTPYAAILGTSTLAALLVLPLNYRTLIGMSNTAVAVQYGATCLAVLVNGITKRSQNKALTIVPLLGMAATLGICFAASRAELVLSSLALMVGLFLYFLVQLRKGSAPGKG